MTKMFKMWRITKLLAMIILGMPTIAFALVRDMPVDVTLKNDFVLSPAKIEMTMRPGQSETKYLYITNRFMVPAIFSISVQDFSGSSNPQDGATLVNIASAQNYFNITDASFTSASGEWGMVAANVTIPTAGVASGEFFAALLVSGTPQGLAGGAAKIVSRLGALFFVRTQSNVVEAGVLKDFNFQQSDTLNKKQSFTLTFENTGTTHLNPYGGIEVRNMFGKLIRVIPVDPWFVMPQFTRIRVLAVDDIRTWGKYTATARVNRGYQNHIDERTIQFWILPSMFAMVAGGTGLGILGIVLIYIVIKRKNKLHGARI